MCPIPFPYPIMGYTYDSNNQLLPNTVVYVSSGSNLLTLVSNSGGKYVGNIMNYAYSGCYISTSAIGKSEKQPKNISKVVMSSMRLYKDIHLTEANIAGKISINTVRDYENRLYIFTPTPALCNKMWYKTIE